VAYNRINTVTANCIIVLLASMHVLRVKNQIKPFQQKSIKVNVPVTKSINFSYADACWYQWFHSVCKQVTFNNIVTRPV